MRVRAGGHGSAQPDPCAGRIIDENDRVGRRLGASGAGGAFDATWNGETDAVNDRTPDRDATTARLIGFARRYRFETLDGTTVHEAKRRLIDTIGSALGACHQHPCALARTLVARWRGDSTATVWAVASA